MTYRLGVDVGGTLADLVIHEVETNRLERARGVYAVALAPNTYRIDDNETRRLR